VSSTLLTLVGLAIIFATYYGLVVPRIGDRVARGALTVVSARWTGARSVSVGELDGVLRLAIAGLMQLAFCTALLVALGIAPPDLVQGPPRLELLAAGAVLGGAEAALGSFLGMVGMRAAAALDHDATAPSPQEWIGLARAGWMRLYTRTAEVLPLPPLAALILLYVAVEEVVFRGVVIAAVGDAGMGVALAASVTLFVGIQVFNMPSWRAAMFPVLGALVVGVVHGALYLAVPDITPLIVAHFVLFMVAAT
jgi:hypothetical protein